MAAPRGLAKCDRAVSTTACVSSCSWFLAAGPDGLAVLVTPDVDLALAAGEYLGGELQGGRNEALVAMSAGSSPGSRNTGTVVLATLVERS